MMARLAKLQSFTAILFIILNGTMGFGIGVEQKLPTEFDRNISRQLSMSIHDEKYRYFIENVLLYCPATDLCKSGYVRKVDFNSGTFPCCFLCKCSDDCHQTRMCCPTVQYDQEKAVNSTETSVSREFSFLRNDVHCLFPQLLPYSYTSKLTHTNSIFSYLMIWRCPVKYNDDHISRNCKEAGKSLDPKMNIELVIPVKSNLTDFIYRNKYCALCHGEHAKNLVRWAGQLDCQSLGHFNARSYQEMLTEIITDKTQKCNLIFEPDITDKNVVKCNWGAVNECNVTGRWEVYDPMIEAGCHSFTLRYKMKYRNVFCYMCNEREEPFMRCTPNDMMMMGFHMVGGFKAKLDFNVEGHYYNADNAVRNDPKESENCQPNAMYDHYKEKCRNITCSPQLAYINSRCLSIFQEVSMQNYEMFIRFKPHFPVFDNCESCVTNAANSMVEYVSELLSKSAYDRFVCMIEILYATTNSEPVGNAVLKNISYLVVHVKTRVRGFHDTNMVLADLSKIESADVSLKMNLSFVSDVLVSFNVRLIDDGSVDNTNDIGIMEPHGNKINSNIPEFLFYHPKLQVAMLIPHCGLTVRNTIVSNFKVCPRITLTENEYTITKNNSWNSICLEEVDLCFESGDHSNLRNGTMEVCAKLYLEHVKKLISRNSVDVIERDARFVSLYCTSLSLIVLIVTIYKMLRMKKHGTLIGKINLILCLMLFFSHFLHGFSFNVSMISDACKIAGAMTHFAWMIVILWTNIACLNVFRVFFCMQKSYRSDVEIKMLIIFFAYTIIVSSTIVAAHIGISKFFHSNIGYGGIWCFISTKEMFLYTFTVPLSIILLSNLAMFIPVAVKFGSYIEVRKPLNYQYKTLKVYASFSVLVGITWTLGTVHMWIPAPALSYTFIASNVCQCVFLSLVTLCVNENFKKSSRQHYLDMFKNQSLNTSTTLTTDTSYKKRSDGRTIEDTYTDTSVPTSTL